MEKNTMIDFLVRAAIPMVTETDCLPRKNGSVETSNLLWDAIYRAHRDVLTGRKNVTEYSGKREVIRTMKKEEKVYGPNQIAQCLYYEVRDCSKKNEQLRPMTLIEKLHEGYSDVSFGCIQKLVNMTVKYLYILQEFGYLQQYRYDLPRIDESACDCPIDSIILERIGQSEIKWTKILEKKTYEMIQECVDSKKADADTRLEYDFRCWNSFQKCPWTK